MKTLYYVISNNSGYIASVCTVESLAYQLAKSLKVYYVEPREVTEEQFNLIENLNKKPKLKPDITLYRSVVEWLIEDDERRIDECPKVNYMYHYYVGRISAFKNILAFFEEEN